MCPRDPNRSSIPAIKQDGFNFFWRTQVIFVGPLIPRFGLLVMSVLGFKARVDPLYAAFSPVCYVSDSPLV